MGNLRFVLKLGKFSPVVYFSSIQEEAVISKVSQELGWIRWDKVRVKSVSLKRRTEDTLQTLE